MELKKENVAIRLTKKNIAKVYGILKMFPKENIMGITEMWLSTDEPCKYNPFIAFNDREEWCGFSEIGNRTIIKPKQLRNMLYAEHCKEGDYVVARGFGEKEHEYIAKVKKVVESDVKGMIGISLYSQKMINSNRLEKNVINHGSFLRYATQEEIELLDGKRSDQKLEEDLSNKWYFLDKMNAAYDAIIYFNGKSCYGINHLNEWTEKYNPEAISKSKSYGPCRPATEEEVKAALVNEAKRRFKGGFKFIPLNGTIAVTVDEGLSFDYYGYITVAINKDEWDNADRMSNPTIYKDGKWAEIVEEKPNYRLSSGCIIWDGEETIANVYDPKIAKKILSFLNSEK